MKNVASVLLFSLLGVACSGSVDTTTITPATPGPTEDPNGAGGETPAEPEAPVVPGEQPKVFSLADGLSINEISLNQGVKVSIMKDGAMVTTRKAPVVAGRKGRLRVFVTPAASWDGRSVTCELRLSRNGTTPVLLTAKLATKSKSTDALNSSTCNFDIDGTDLATDTYFSIALVDATATAAAPGDNAALFPMDGKTEDMGLLATGKVKIVVVPVQYDTDGSGRLPDVSASQLAIYKKTMLGRYPASDVEVTVHEPYAWTQTIDRTGNGFSSMLNAIVKLRQTDHADEDTYYYGALAPAASFGSFCQSNCVTGLSPLAQSPQDSVARASIGVGFSGDSSAGTMAHEVGHAHGRNHAPCGGAQGVDPSFPYSTGGIGAWGFDINTSVDMDPSKYKDMMGYCQPGWVSDYTFAALHERIAIVTGAKGMSAATPASYQLVAVEKGAVTSVETVTLDRPPMGEEKAFTFLTKSGAPIGAGKARFYKYDHLDGGIYMIPTAAASVTSVRMDGLSKALEIRK